MLFVRSAAADVVVRWMLPMACMGTGTDAAVAVAALDVVALYVLK